MFLENHGIHIQVTTNTLISMCVCVFSIVEAPMGQKLKCFFTWWRHRFLNKGLRLNSVTKLFRKRNEPLEFHILAEKSSH